MRTFDYSALADLPLDPDIVFLLGRIHEAKGKQEIFFAQKPKELDKLVEIAKIQSTETSNAIEGISTTSTRLKQLLTEKTTPKNRAEAEIAGYRDVLKVIHESYNYIPLTANYILQLHKILYDRTGLEIGGKFKQQPNYITATDDQGQTYTLFTPLAPWATPEAIKTICEQFNQALTANKVDPLILIPVFVHDFLCIHPFVDGNGRMSRLLTTLLLYQCGYLVGKYISLEAKIAQDKNLYYDALAKTQVGWHEGKDNPTEFIKYLLGTIVAAYRDFEARIAMVSLKTNSSIVVKEAIAKLVGKFTKGDIINLCPNLGVKTIEKCLTELTAAGEIQKHGSARATFYTRNN